MTEHIEIRAPREEEFPTILKIGSLAFGEEVAPEDEESFRLSFPFDRGLSAYEDGKMVATSAVYSLELTLPGLATVPTGGVTWIATLPTHRRRGLLRRLMTAHIADMTERGEPLSALFASEGGIYGHFGYGPATSTMSFTIERAHARFAAPVERATGRRITLVEPEEAAVEFPPLYDRFRLLVPGMVSRPVPWWSHHLSDPVSEREGAGRMYHAKHESAPGEADGYVSYRLKEGWGPSSLPMNELQVLDLAAADPGVYKALWDYVLGTDLCQTISCWRGRVDEPLRWLLSDPRRLEVKALVDDLYLRLLDVPRALAARAYGAAGELVMQVHDIFPVAGEARYLLCSDPTATPAGGGQPVAQCSPTSRDPDLELGIDRLAAVYLGGVSFATLAAAGRVRELTPGAVARADAMFATAVAPYCSTMF